MPQREPTRVSSEEIARRVLERGSLPQPRDDDFQQWTAVAVDIDDAAGIGAVAAVRRSGRQAWYAAIEICRRSLDGRWHPDQGNGDQWSQDPRRRPPGSGFVSGTSTYGCQVQGVWIVTFAGIVGEDVTALRLVEPTAREVAINPVNGAYVVAAARRGGDLPPPVHLIAHGAHGQSDEIRWQPPPDRGWPTGTSGPEVIRRPPS